jgi:hypothetical protein
MNTKINLEYNRHKQTNKNNKDKQIFSLIVCLKADNVHESPEFVDQIQPACNIYIFFLV